MDAVNHPEHYTSGGIECIDAIRASLGNKEFADYCKGNIIKISEYYEIECRVNAHRHSTGLCDTQKMAVWRWQNQKYRR